MTTLSTYISQRRELTCLCGNKRGVTIRRKDRYGLKFRYKLCLRCGHVRTSNPLSEEAATDFYKSSDYRSMYFPGDEPREVLLRKTPKPGSQTPLLQFISDFCTSPGTIVEWGCGGGWNLTPFRDAGWKVVGFDFDSRYVRLGREILGLDLREIEANQTRVGVSESPDVVLLNHVLEHAVDPRALLELLKSVCDDKSIIVVGIPLLETIRFWHWKPFFHIAHIHYFSSRTLELLASQAQLLVTHKNPDKGLFVLKRISSDTASERLQSRRSAIESTAYLAVGFFDVGFRLRESLKKLLKILGLLERARRLRKGMRR